MPNINLGTLSGINGLNAASQVAQMTQPHGGAHCGAYALVAALGAFGTPPVVVNTPINYGASHQTLTAHDDFPGLALKIYNLTGILNAAIDPPHAANPELVAAGGYNSPAALASVARQLGFNVTAHLTVAGALLEAIYPGETPRTIAVLGANHIHTNLPNINEPPLPIAGETQMVCVHNNTHGLHMLARGSNGEYYDPADGSLNNGFHFDFAGLWLTFSRP